MRAVVIVLGAYVAATSAGAAPAQLPAACQRMLEKQYPNWKEAVIPPDAEAYAQSQGMNPRVSTGDFDGDARRDWAALIQVAGKSRLVLCLAGQGSVTLIEASDVNCVDLVFTFKRRTRLPNLETGREEILRNDSPATSCFEKSGQTFVLERRRLRTFYHSD